MVFAEEEDIFQSRNHVKILQVLQPVMVPLKCTQVLKVCENVQSPQWWAVRAQGLSGKESEVL